MGELKEQISNNLKQAMKDKDMVKLNVLRVLKSELERNEQTSKGKIELSEADIVKQVKKMIENIEESKGDINEILILKDYLPKQLTSDEIKLIIATNKITNVGEGMKYFKTNYNGCYDGQAVSNLIKELVL